MPKRQETPLTPGSRELQACRQFKRHAHGLKCCRAVSLTPAACGLIAFVQTATVPAPDTPFCRVASEQGGVIVMLEMGQSMQGKNPEHEWHAADVPQLL